MAGKFTTLLVTVPHCSGETPPEIFASMLECGEPEVELRKRLFNEGDPFTDKLFSMPGAVHLRAPFTRFAVDLNRARSETGPNGVIKTTDFQLKPFYGKSYSLDTAERERRLRAYYDPFYAEVDRRLSTKKFRFFLDGHSMTAQGPTLGPDKGLPRPALCIGTYGDAQGEPTNGVTPTLDPILARATRDFAADLVTKKFPQWKSKHTVLLNQPFEGGELLRHYSQAESPYRIPGMMLEINRALYLDENTLEPLEGAIDRWKALLAELFLFLLPQLG